MCKDWTGKCSLLIVSMRWLATIGNHALGGDRQDKGRSNQLFYIQCFRTRDFPGRRSLKRCDFRISTELPWRESEIVNQNHNARCEQQELVTLPFYRHLGGLVTLGWIHGLIFCSCSVLEGLHSLVFSSRKCSLSIPFSTI